MVKITLFIKGEMAFCFMKKVFTLGIQSTQLSKCLNSDVRKCLNPDVNIVRFFKHFEQVVEDKRYNELMSEFKARDQVARLKCVSSRMLQHLSGIYTPTIFETFQEQFDLFFACSIKQRKEIGSLLEYIVHMDVSEGEWTVWFHPQESSISCSCKKFERVGILCCHALTVLIINNVKMIPD